MSALPNHHSTSQWQWMADDGSWVEYDFSTNTMIEADFLAGATMKRLFSASGGMHGTGATYDLIFRDMSQVNSRTGFKRDIRRYAGLHARCDEVWSWKRSSTWEAFPMWVNLQLIAVRDSRRQSSTSVVILGAIYDIHFARLSAVNRRTGVRHRMRYEGNVSSNTVWTTRPSNFAINPGVFSIGTVPSYAQNSTVGSVTSNAYHSSVASSTPNLFPHRGLPSPLSSVLSNAQGNLASSALPSARSSAAGSVSNNSPGNATGASSMPGRTVNSFAHGPRPGSSVVTTRSRDQEFRQIITSSTVCTSSTSPDDTCAVCMEGFSSQDPALLLPRCRGHYIHEACALKVFQILGPKCPTCSTMYGELLGDQPDGEMSVMIYPPGMMPLASYESYGTIKITYTFGSGTQGSKHPNPGEHYRGTNRLAYLPDHEEGQEVLRLLRKAFAQRMTFTIGTSITTGRSHSVVWNGIHHKTNVSGGIAAYGYPDPTYFTRVKVELAAKGIH